MKGIIGKFECPQCGNILNKEDVLKTNNLKTKYTFDAPKKCTCGAKNGFTMLSFKSASVIIEADDVIKDDEQTDE